MIKRLIFLETEAGHVSEAIVILAVGVAVSVLILIGHAERVLCARSLFRCWIRAIRVVAARW